jgi:hypothetical protein
LFTNCTEEEEDDDDDDEDNELDNVLSACMSIVDAETSRWAVLSLIALVPCEDPAAAAPGNVVDGVQSAPSASPFAGFPRLPGRTCVVFWGFTELLLNPTLVFVLVAFELLLLLLFACEDA